jgi:hypothetical protein
MKTNETKYMNMEHNKNQEQDHNKDSKTRMFDVISHE